MIGQSPYGGGDGLVVGDVAAPVIPCGHGQAVRLPSRGQLTYTRELLTVVLLLCAFPWLLSKLLTDPGSVLRTGGISKTV